MNIIICGAGEVGRHSAEVLTSAGHNITVIDQDPQKLASLDEMLDVQSLAGNGTRADILAEAGVSSADLFIAATNVDEVNLLAASVAKGVGASQSVARVHHSAYFESRGLDYARHLGIDRLVCPEYSTARAIASTLRSPGALEIEQFARGKIEMQSLRVSPDAGAVGAALRDLRLPGPARLAAIERDGTAFLPEAQTVIRADDVVTLIGDAQRFDKIAKVFHPERDVGRRVILLGGTSLAVWLCRALRHRGISIRLFEPEQARALELAEKLSWITVIRADPINTTDALKEERIDLADAFVALTDDDEQNLLAAAQAKSLGARSAIAVLQRPTYLHLVEHIGIDWAFSPRATAVTEILRLLDTGPVRKLASLADDTADVYEVRVSSDIDVAHKPLRDVQFPPQVAIAAVQRGDEVFVPGGESTIEPDDMLIVIAPVGTRREVRRMFGGS